MSEGTAHDWPSLVGHGVDWVEVNSARLHSQSLYWLYPDGESVVVGCGSVAYDHESSPIVEFVFSDDGVQERRCRFMPDLRHEQIKLGWWWPGKPRPE